MMRKTLAIALALWLGFIPAAIAADNGVVVTVGSGTTMKSKDVGSGVQAMQPILSDTNGNPLAASNPLNVEGSANQIYLTAAMTTSNNTVTTGKSIGGLQAIANAARTSAATGSAGTGGMIQTVVLTFKDAIGTIPMDVYFFRANPTGSTCTDNTSFALVDADRDKVIGVVHVTDWIASNTAAIGQANNQAMAYSLGSATSFYACVVTRASVVVTGTANTSLNATVLRN